MERLAPRPDIARCVTPPGAGRAATRASGPFPQAKTGRAAAQHRGNRPSCADAEHPWAEPGRLVLRSPAPPRRVVARAACLRADTWPAFQNDSASARRPGERCVLGSRLIFRTEQGSIRTPRSTTAIRLAHRTRRSSNIMRPGLPGDAPPIRHVHRAAGPARSSLRGVVPSRSDGRVPRSPLRRSPARLPQRAAFDPFAHRRFPGFTAPGPAPITRAMTDTFAIRTCILRITGPAR